MGFEKVVEGEWIHPERANADEHQMPLVAGWCPVVAAFFLSGPGSVRSVVHLS